VIGVSLWIAEQVDGCGIGAAGIGANALNKAAPTLNRAQVLVVGRPLGDGIILGVVFL